MSALLTMLTGTLTALGVVGLLLQHLPALGWRLHRRLQGRPVGVVVQLSPWPALLALGGVAALLLLHRVR